eukprot:TRINITY_DN8389_c0_g1_i2.p1 TRINITY_DN8389_c0_g1~~TRINITY_DN8389_c0_g1_i2.p1  ORF type:complete len:1242 (+),score=254.24 TRINITY_DN8389_c0_g1_i2:255-3980(+)
MLVPSSSAPSASAARAVGRADGTTQRTQRGYALLMATRSRPTAIAVTSMPTASARSRARGRSGPWSPNPSVSMKMCRAGSGTSASRSSAYSTAAPSAVPGCAASSGRFSARHAASFPAASRGPSGRRRSVTVLLKASIPTASMPAASSASVNSTDASKMHRATCPRVDMETSRHRTIAWRRTGPAVLAAKIFLYVHSVMYARINPRRSSWAPRVDACRRVKTFAGSRRSSTTSVIAGRVPSSRATRAHSISTARSSGIDSPPITAERLTAAEANNAHSSFTSASASARSCRSRTAVSAASSPVGTVEAPGMEPPGDTAKRSVGPPPVPSLHTVSAVTVRWRSRPATRPHCNFSVRLLRVPSDTTLIGPRTACCGLEAPAAAAAAAGASRPQQAVRGPMSVVSDGTLSRRTEKLQWGRVAGLLRQRTVTAETVCKDGTGGGPTDLFAVSPGGSIPGASTVPTGEEAAETAVLLLQERAEALAEVKDECALFASAAVNLSAVIGGESMPLLRAVEMEWARVARELGTLPAMTDVVEERLLPANVFTRRQASTRGAQLDLRGLMRAYITEWTYKKIFAAKTAGPVRRHAIVLCLDVSMSTRGHVARCILEASVLLTEALEAAGIEAVGMLAFSNTVTLLRRPDGPLDAAGKLAACLALNLPDDAAHPGTADGAAVEYALDLLADVPEPARHIFMLTDGFGDHGPDLPRALLRADAVGIEVTAIAVGLDRVAISKAYPRWVRCVVPSALPTALAALAEGAEDDGTNISPDGGPFRKDVDAAADAPGEVSEEEPDAAWMDSVRRQMRDLREVALFGKGGAGGGAAALDLVFIIDGTASMRTMWDDVGGVVKRITQEVAARVREQTGVELATRPAAVVFRDHDAPCEVRDFPPLPANGAPLAHADSAAAVQGLTTWLGQRPAFGGGDEPEDVASGLRAASRLTFGGKVRIAILITDAAAHGLAPPGVKDDQPEAAEDLRKAVREYRVGSNGGHLVLVSCSTRDTEKTFAEICGTWAQMEAEQEERQQRGQNAYSASSITRAALLQEGERRRGTHVIFLLDESWSMQGHRFETLCQAVTQFKESPAAGQVLATVICFSCTARVVCSGVSLDQLPVPDYNGGNTSFGAAFAAGITAMDGVGQGYRSVIMFMTDGEAPPPVAELRRLAQQHPQSKVYGFLLGDGTLDGVLSTLPADILQPPVVVARAEELMEHFKKVRREEVDKCVGAIASQVADTVVTAVSTFIATTCT